MRRLLIVLAAAAAFLFGQAGLAAGTDREVQDYLEGVWVNSGPPDQGSCLTHWYDNTELEFEFRKSGGRLLIFEHYDLFSAIAIPKIERVGDVFSVSALPRKASAVVPMFRFHRVGADEFEIVPKEGGDPSKPPEKWYRCGAADRAVTASVGMRDLAILTPNWSGSQTLFEVQPDISDADICQGEDHGERRRIRTLQFEALGPVHYWVFGRGFEAPRKLEFDYIRSIRKIGAHKLRLEMQEHSGSGGGWDASKPGREGKKYVLTVIERGSRIKIPELSGVFARCQAGDPVGMGMHRY